MASRRYTSKELRESADNFPYLFSGTAWKKIVAMIRQAAEMREVIDKLVELISKEICYPSESNCKTCGFRRGSDCGCMSNNRMMHILEVAKGATDGSK